MSTWSLTGVAKAPTETKSISHWGPSGTLGAHTTVGAPASTWPGSRRLLRAVQSFCVVHTNPANLLVA